MESDSNNKKEFLLKNVSFYHSILNAWIYNRTQTDKYYLNLSVLALVYMLFSIDKNALAYSLLAGVCAVIAFFLVILNIFSVFDLNAEYCESILKEDDESKTKKISAELTKLSSYIKWQFIAACFLMFFFIFLSKIK